MYRCPNRGTSTPVTLLICRTAVVVLRSESDLASLFHTSAWHRILIVRVVQKHTARSTRLFFWVGQPPLGCLLGSTPTLGVLGLAHRSPQPWKASSVGGVRVGVDCDVDDGDYWRGGGHLARKFAVTIPTQTYTRDGLNCLFCRLPKRIPRI